MAKTELEGAASRFFDDFVEAFRSFDGITIAQRYLTPYLAFHTHGAADVFLSHADTADYFQRIVSAYHAKGCRSCRYNDLEIVPIGRECALATVTWELLSEDQAVLETWRESYNLCLVESRFLVFASTDHVA
ncbi:MAG: hypothetical protein A3I66_04815 [Burkholderiales bacterium RIFCSPLOWO2_02_FULL_57_36]|nr:MAG: hypothetical protein A3I66_04815 [Burkholderiales bacterium RIFCSPLOWO2_02_FULL_57_36]